VHFNPSSYSTGVNIKILLVHKYFRPTGGAEVFFFEVGRILKENGHEVAYLSTHHDSNKESDYHNFFIHEPSFHSENIITKLKALPKVIYNREAKKQIQRLIDVFQPDLVHLFGIFTQISTSILDITFIKKIPVLMSCNDYKHICPNYMLYYNGNICNDCETGNYFNAIKNKTAFLIKWKEFMVAPISFKSNIYNLIVNE